MLTAVQGIVSEMIITNIAGGNLATTFKPYASYELLDSSGSSLIGGMPVTLDYQRYVVDAGRQSSSAVDALSAGSYPIIIEFGNAKADFHTGRGF